MSFQCNTINYVWTEKGKLGAGAGGTVYRAWHKTTGDVVAIKTILPSVQYNVPKEVRMREYDILSRYIHQTINRALPFLSNH